MNGMLTVLEKDDKIIWGMARNICFLIDNDILTSVCLLFDVRVPGFRLISIFPSVKLIIWPLLEADHFHAIGCEEV